MDLPLHTAPYYSTGIAYIVRLATRFFCSITLGFTINDYGLWFYSDMMSYDSL